MGGTIDAIEYLGIPGTIACAIIALFLVMQIIGELIDLKSKTAPEFLKIRKYFARKKKEKKDLEDTIKECKALLSDFNSHYAEDNIAKRDKWIDKMNNSVKNNDTFIQKLDSKIDTLNEIISKFEEFIDELIIHISDKSKKDVNNLTKELDDLINSVKDY